MTGVQTCALPICLPTRPEIRSRLEPEGRTNCEVPLFNFVEARYALDGFLGHHLGKQFSQRLKMTSLATKSQRSSPPKRRRSDRLDVGSDVLTLAEAAEYLRISNDEVVQLTTQRGLPGRRAGHDWRFLKTALQDWLKRPEPLTDNAVFLELAGRFQDDPFLEDIVADAYRQRGRPITESAK